MNWEKIERTAASRIADRESTFRNRIEELIIQGMEMGLSTIKFREEPFLEVEKILNDDRLTVEATGNACGHSQKEWKISW